MESTMTHEMGPYDTKSRAMKVVGRFIRIENELFLAISGKPRYSPSFGAWWIDLAVRPATEREKANVKIAALDKERSALMPQWDNPTPDASAVADRARMTAIDSELSSLKSIA